MNIEEVKEMVVILIDSREQRCLHVVSALSEMGIRFKTKALKFGDYSLMFDGISLENKCVVERKAHLLELAGNFCRGRMRFDAEFTKAANAGAKVCLLVEDASARDKIILRHQKDADKTLTAEQRQKGTWKSNFCANSMIASISRFKEKYNLDVEFVDKRDTARCMLDFFGGEIDRHLISSEV